jgi:hypothetical protein
MLAGLPRLRRTMPSVLCGDTGICCHRSAPGPILLIAKASLIERKPVSMPDK